MDNLLGKVVKQAIGQKGQGQNEPSSNSGLLHKVTDAVTGQKHPGEGQFAPNPYTQGQYGSAYNNPEERYLHQSMNNYSGPGEYHGQPRQGPNDPHRNEYGQSSGPMHNRGYGESRMNAQYGHGYPGREAEYGNEHGYNERGGYQQSYNASHGAGPGYIGARAGHEERQGHGGDHGGQYGNYGHGNQYGYEQGGHDERRNH